MQCFFRASNMAFFSSQDVHLRMVEMLALRQSCVTPSLSSSSYLSSSTSSSLQSVRFGRFSSPSSPDAQGRCDVCSEAVPSHSSHRSVAPAPKTIQNKQSLCDTAKKSSFARCWNTCWLSLTFEKKKLSLDSVCTALFSQVEVSQRSRLQIFKH